MFVFPVRLRVLTTSRPRHVSSPRNVERSVWISRSTLSRFAIDCTKNRSCGGAVKKVLRHMLQARKRKGFGWTRCSRPWLYETLKLFNSYRVRRSGPKVARAG
jgi:RNA-directed DNA polymerase